LQERKRDEAVVEVCSMHVRGPAAAKDRFPSDDIVRGTATELDAADLRPGLTFDLSTSNMQRNDRGTAAEFTVKNKHFIRWLWMSKKCKPKFSIKVFPDRWGRLKTLNGERDSCRSAAMTHVRVVVDRTLPAQLRISANLKISQLFYWNYLIIEIIFIIIIIIIMRRLLFVMIKSCSIAFLLRFTYLFHFEYLVAFSAVRWHVVLIMVKNNRQLKVVQDGSGWVGSRVSC